MAQGDDRRCRSRRSLAGSLLVALVVAGVLVVGAADVDASTPAVFGPETSFPTATETQDIEMADLNGDSILDVVVSSNGATGVSVLLGVGDGGFAARTDYVTSPEPVSVGIGDLSGDMVPDVAVTSWGDDVVSVLVGLGDGTFAPPVDYATGSDPTGLALVDLDGDGSTDLVTSNYLDDTVSVFLNLGDGTLGPPTDYPTGAGPLDLAVGDLDGDAVPDLVTIDSGDNRVSVRLGAGGGTFGPATGHPTGAFPIQAVLADVTGDGFPDLAVSNQDSDSVSVLLGQGDGGFDTSAEHPISAGGAIAATDLDRDTLVDLVVSDYGRETVTVLSGLGAGAFAGPTAHPVSHGPSNLAIGDVDHDGRPDVVLTMFEPATVVVLRNLTPVTAPGAPVIGVASGGDGSAVVSWAAPVSDGGSPVTGYVVTPYVGFYPLPSTTFASTATTQVVPGLSNGVTYRFRVRAVNALGTGPFSRATNPITAGDALPGFFSGTHSWSFSTGGCLFVHQVFDAAFNAFGGHGDGVVSLDGCVTIVREYEFAYDGTFTLTPVGGPVVTGIVSGEVFSGAPDARDFDFVLTPDVGSPIHMVGATPFAASNLIHGFLSQL